MFMLLFSKRQKSGPQCNIVINTSVIPLILATRMISSEVLPNICSCIPQKKVMGWVWNNMMVRKL